MSEVASTLRTSDFDYPLDQSRIAQRPLAERDAAKLLVVDTARRALEDRIVRDLPDMLNPDDILVINETRVFSARLLGRKPTGASIEVLLMRPLGADERRWSALVRPGGKLKPGRIVEISDELRLHIEDSTDDGGRVVRLETSLPAAEAIGRFGHVPLPPYIQREDDAEDRVRYQTVYAREVGSVAAPTAGLHFTDELLDRIDERGVGIARVTLHVGPGTFRPVESESPSAHRIHPEWYSVSDDAAAIINEGRARGGRVWAVGTTSLRTLESAVGAEGAVAAGSGWTELFVLPGYEFRVVDRLITNFHLPRSTLLMLVSAFAGHELTLEAYRHALARDYRFYSYGDAMVIR